MAQIDTRGLERFIKKVSLYKLDDKKLDDIVGRIAERGVQIINEKYGGRTDIVITTLKDGQGGCKLIASGQGLSFEEFGTGEVGRGSYKGQLPTETIRFPSKFTKEGFDETKGWEYNYRKEKRGTDYWWYNGWITYGQPASAQMFHTAQDLRQEIANLVIKKVKERSK